MQLFRALVISMLLATSVAKERARGKLVNGTHGPKGYSPYRLQRYPTEINTSQLPTHASPSSAMYPGHMYAAGSKGGPSAAIRF